MKADATRPSTTGGGSATRRTRGARCGGTGGSLATFRGVERNVTAWPLAARRMASSKYGIMCPIASHGNRTTSSFVAVASPIFEPCGRGQQWWRSKAGGADSRGVDDLFVKVGPLGF